MSGQSEARSYFFCIEQEQGTRTGTYSIWEKLPLAALCPHGNQVSLQNAMQDYSKS
jgi:hypothetical protein